MMQIFQVNFYGFLVVAVVDMAKEFLFIEMMNMKNRFPSSMRKKPTLLLGHLCFFSRTCNSIFF